MAGDSADEVARRAREKAERLLQQAERFEKGAAGERIVAELLEQLPDDWFVLNDIHWPGRSRANIDHVVIGPSGVFVIDAKNWSGSITIKGGVLRCGGYAKTRTVENVQAAAQAVGSLLPSVHPNFIIPVLCFVGEAQAHGSVSGVEVCAGESLVAMLQYMPIVFSSEELQFLRFQLDVSTGSALEPVQRTFPTLPPPEPPPPHAPPLVVAPSSRHRSRRPSLLKRILQGVGLWWLICVVVYLAIGRAVHDNPQLLGSAYLVAALYVVSLMRAPRQKGGARRR